MNDVDRELLAGLPAHARVAIVPTAAGLEDTPRQWVAIGVEHFRALGAVPVPLLVLDRSHASDPRWAAAVATVDWVYFSGGDPGHLVASLEGTPFWSAVGARYRDGAILAGASAGAMAFGETTFVPSDRGADGFPRAVRTRRGLGLLRGVIVAPHFDILPDWVLEDWSGVVPEGHRVLGIDEDTALIDGGGAWIVRGRGRVHVIRTLVDREVHESGNAVVGLPAAALP